MDQHHRNPWAIAGQVIAALITTAATICSVVLALLVVESRLGPTSNDPHGYTLIFGSLLLVPTSIVGAISLPSRPTAAEASGAHRCRRRLGRLGRGGSPGGGVRPSRGTRVQRHRTLSVVTA
ncbi:hypothetical protein ACRTEC_11500 [Janibacter indicus]